MYQIHVGKHNAENNANENEKKKERQGGEGYEESETGAEGSMQETDSL